MCTKVSEPRKIIRLLFTRRAWVNIRQQKETTFDTYFLRLGEIQVVHDLHKLIHVLSQARVKLALLTNCGRCLTWYTKIHTVQCVICGNCGLDVCQMSKFTDQSKAIQYSITADKWHGAGTHVNMRCTAGTDLHQSFLLLLVCTCIFKTAIAIRCISYQYSLLQLEATL